ncbi:MAG TPA: hydrogenase expression/formation C-terminal domain-containing protein [Rhodocyclaceae bacterium]|nr:hydrogenase expression/formation C-terminal domain-containing protein [Rhodocyclaceae bacterium]
MKPFPIPVVPMLGPGSQPEEEDLHYLPAPGDMSVFRAPIPRTPATPEALAGAKRILEDLVARMADTAFASAAPASLNLLGEAPEVVTEINELMGQGEVSVLVKGSRTLRVQETAFPSVWRVQSLREDGTLEQDTIEAGPMPLLVQAAVSSAPTTAQRQPAPAGLMNAPALVNELFDQSARHQAGNEAHVINLTLLPVTPEDLQYLSDCLSFGNVTMLSRGYGNCRITATGLPHTWWVQYFNSLDQLILNTLEVVTIPEAALAAKEDYEDSIERLREWIISLDDL